ncbi:MAG: UDP-N-acetylmuramoyl-L-alanine--D-glutamate ligase [Flavobacteriaceae bacterium]|nr:UDP-N-acetylmuramoyl-L-alanine--D-glutamate ligase [Flavobacteriaceae bacterium]
MEENKKHNKSQNVPPSGDRGNLVILGGGESGVGTAILGKQKGFEVFLSDRGEIKEKYKKVLLQYEIDFEENQHTESKILNADIVMKSPGIPDKVALIQKIKEKGIKCISEIEFASKYTDATIIGITGSNGKTTTTMLTHHILKSAGLNVGVGGNIGDSFARQVAEKDFSSYVLELSSFQLDDIVSFRPHIAIITNITPDHLDRYDYKFENYINSKFRITKNQTEDDYLIYDADDEVIVKWLENNKIRAKLVPFSLEKEVKNGAFLSKDKLFIKKENIEELMDIATLKIQGKHNTKNALAAAMTASIQRVRNREIRNSLQNFEGVEHRLEPVLKINGVQYINDSKATNINATYYALESVRKPIVWIAGGQDKGNDYLELMSLVREKVKGIICLGVDNQKIIDSFSNVVETIIETRSASEAVQEAYKMAESGDVVLLSPACASFDLFENFEDRGRQFKEAVQKL